jgi:hypothetical protein
MDYKNLYVTNNNNDGAGSLRAVLEETQRTQGNYNIIFRTTEPNPTPTNTFKLGYWTISLDSPLPILARSNIRAP